MCRMCSPIEVDVKSQEKRGVRGGTCLVCVENALVLTMPPVERERGSTLGTGGVGWMLGDEMPPSARFAKDRGREGSPVWRLGARSDRGV